MLMLGSPHVHPPRAVLDAPGGFLWWYAELLDHERKNGLVMIWSFGLPFLPGYAAAERAGRASAARARPSLNVVIYRDGQEDLYVLHEFAPEHVEWDGAFSWRFGQSTFTVEEEDGQRTLVAKLDCPVPGLSTPLRGQVRVMGNTAHIDASAASTHMGSGASDHAWCPMVGPAFGSALLCCGDEYEFQSCGRAYFDRNFSHSALHRLGIERWLWGHVALEDRERIFYTLWPAGDGDVEVLGFDVHNDGRVEVIEGLVADIPPDKRTFFGMPWWDEVALTRDGAPWLSVALTHRVDDGPFYLRFITDCRAEGASASGSCEIIVPDRIDLHRHRSLVNMRVSSEQHVNSMWNPLFSGPRQGRLRRLIRSSVPGIDAPTVGSPPDGQT